MATVKLIWVLEEGEKQGSYLDSSKAKGMVSSAGQGVRNLASAPASLLARHVTLMKLFVAFPSGILGW